MENSFKNFNNRKPKKHWDGKKEVGNPDAYDGYTYGKSSSQKQRESVDITPEASEPRARISRTTSEKVWDGAKAEKHQNYGQGMFKNLKDKFIPKAKKFKKVVKDFPEVSDSKLKDTFEETRKRVSTELKDVQGLAQKVYGKLSRNERDALRNARDDYQVSYRKQSEELERRGIDVNNKEVYIQEARINAKENYREAVNNISGDNIERGDSSESTRLLGHKDNIKKFGDKIVEVIKEDHSNDMHKFRESLGQNDPEFLEFEADAKEKFQAMNTVIKDLKSKGIDHINDDAYFNAKMEWMNAKARVEAHEESYRDPESKENQG